VPLQERPLVDVLKLMIVILMIQRVFLKHVQILVKHATQLKIRIRLDVQLTHTVALYHQLIGMLSAFQQKHALKRSMVFKLNVQDSLNHVIQLKQLQDVKLENNAPLCLLPERTLVFQILFVVQVKVKKRLFAHQLEPLVILQNLLMNVLTSD